jgi:RNA cap guanine-N2 methyltransferase
MEVEKQAHVRLGPLPSWLDVARLCGRAPRARRPLADGACEVELAMPFAEAALLAAQLRGLGFDGAEPEVHVTPALRRDEVRAGRLEEARLRRDASIGFSRAAARADGEGRYSLTPEPLALALAEGLAGKSVVDACAGSGGNALAFARAGARVTAIEIDAARRAELAHNAGVYGVRDRLTVVAGDALEELPKRTADVLFADPPWGNPYDKRRTTLANLPLLAGLLALPLQGYGALWLKLPPSFVTRELPGFTVEPCFGAAAGDLRRVKFLVLRRGRAP